jgi:phage tail-like protein
MPEDGSTQSSAAWPLPKFTFEVKWDNVVMRFQEVSGLDAEAQPIEYRHGNGPQFSAIKMPGLKKFSDVTMKKGVFKNDNKVWDWFNQFKTTGQRKTVTISLLDEGGQPTMVWTLANAWPNKISGTDLKATGDDVAVETIVFSHEGLTISGG